MLPSFLGFLRLGELTVPSDSTYDPACHLSQGDIVGDNPRDPRVLQVRDSRVLQVRDPRVMQARDSRVMQARDPRVMQVRDSRVMQVRDPRVMQVRDPRVMQVRDPRVMMQGSCKYGIQGSCRHEIPRVMQVRDPRVMQVRDPRVMMQGSCKYGIQGSCRHEIPRVMQVRDPRVMQARDSRVMQVRDSRVMQVRVKQSKTDLFWEGIDLYIGRTALDICPVKAMLNYLAVRGQQEGPLFLFRNGTYLTRQRLVAAVRLAIGRAGLDPSKYCGHSFRIGAATTTAKKGLEDSVMKTLHGEVEESSIPGVHNNPQGTASKLLRETVCMTMCLSM